jgi:type I restriction enzyme S subunit
MQNHFARYATGIAVKQLTGKQIGALSIPLPPLDLQRHFAAIVESVERQKTRMRAHLAELDLLFASLQSRAFNGEL